MLRSCQVPQERLLSRCVRFALRWANRVTGANLALNRSHDWLTWEAKAAAVMAEGESADQKKRTRLQGRTPHASIIC